MERENLTRFAWLSIAAAIITIALKSAAYWFTGSVGLLSDALESLINLAAAIVALLTLRIAAQPADEDHAFGHDKAEYFSSGIEGTLIFIAALSIAYTAIRRLLAPQPLEQLGIGLIVSGVATMVNLLVALVLLKAGKKHHSIILEADGHHLMTDVWTSIGVVIGVGLVNLTGWLRLDPIVAILVAVNIVWTGFGLIKRSVLGLMDTVVAPELQMVAEDVLKKYAEREGITYENFRSRQSGMKKFFYVDIQFPNDWTIYHVHEIADQIEIEIHEKLPNSTVFTHLEPFDK
ncbi:MAG TPA: cation diffusion facilitator family transporter [Pyrinomonadaceae bacterium]|nr:cation diffusion facilitator family transporter [Pyrinomonadaceae bacterium]